MNALRELVRLLLHVAVGVVLTLVLAVLVALVRGGGFVPALTIACYAVGAFTLVLAAAGQSPSRRDAMGASWVDRWAFKGTFAVNRANPGDRTLTTSAVLGLTGIILLGLGVLLGTK